MSLKRIRFRNESFASDEVDLHESNHLPSTSSKIPVGTASESSIDQIFKSDEFFVKCRDDTGLLNSGQEPFRECCCSARFYTTRFTLALTAVLVTCFLLFIVILNLSVLTAEVRGQNKPFIQDPSPDALESDIIFQLVGTSTNLETFTSIPYEKRRHIRAIEMEYVNIPTGVFFTDILTYWRKLEKIHLKYVAFNGSLAWKASSSLMPPDTLLDYTLNYHGPIGSVYNFSIDPCDECIAGITLEDDRRFEGISSKQCLPAFFPLTPNFNDRFAFILGYKPGFNISISLWGWKHFEVNFRQKKLVLSKYPYANDLLGNFSKTEYIELQSLKLHDVTISLQKLRSFAPVLKELHLDNVKFDDLDSSVRLSQVLTNFTKLEQLTLKFGKYIVPPSFPAIGIYLPKLSQRQSLLYTNNTVHIHINDLPSTLKNLTLANVHVTVEITNSTANFNLDQLILYQITMSPGNELLLQFQKIFKASTIAYQVHPIHPSVTTQQSNWLFILNQLSASDPQKIFLDNSFIGRLGTFAYLGGANSSVAQVLRNEQAAQSKAVIISKALRVETMTANNMQISPQKSTSLQETWFNLLQMEAFLEKSFLSIKEW